MINWERVEELKADIGPEDFGEVVEVFLEEVQQTLGSIDFCATHTEMEEKLHFLKGSALNLGFREFSKLCARYETAAAEGDLHEIPVAAVKESYRQTKEAFLARI